MCSSDLEPSLNMYFQLGSAAVLERRLRAHFGVDLAIQPDYNRELARRGSLDGSYSTIDLSSASDCISLKLLADCLPREAYLHFLRLRSPKLLMKNGEKIELHMCSTMGNGFTFPLQTILFASIVRAVMIETDGLWAIRDPSRSRLGNWGVFGDDIVVHKKYARRVLHLLDILGFQPNPNKTFSEGPFRESCGFDWYLGQQTRGAYLKALDTTQARFTAVNILNRWSARSGVPLVNTISYLLEGCPKILVPFDEQDDAGVKVPSSFVGGSLRRVYHYKRFVPIVNSLDIGESNLRRRGVTVNTYGLYISFLRGEVRGGAIAQRSAVTRYRLRAALTPNWDRCFMVNGSVPFSARGCNAPLPRVTEAVRSEWLRWKTAVETNLKD